MTTETKLSFSAALLSTCEAFRMGLEGEANEHLVSLIDALSQLMAKIPQDTLIQLTPLITKTLSAIECKDNLWAADLLEYEIRPLLEPRYNIANELPINRRDI